MRIVSWNMRGATAVSPAWTYLRELEPDLALLQEVRSIPAEVPAEFKVASRAATGKRGNTQRFSTVLLVRAAAADEHLLVSHRPWVQTELDLFRGNLVAARIQRASGTPFVAVSVYSPAWPVDPTRLLDTDTSDVRMMLHPTKSVYVADLLLDAIRGAEEQAFIVGGDFNLSETFDSWRGGPRGNREYLDRMASCGFVECLRHAQGQLTPTFRNPRGGAVIHQMDHLFLPRSLIPSLLDCVVGEPAVVFGSRLSDHLPIVADLAL